jgi:hypothetical protein
MEIGLGWFEEEGREREKKMGWRRVGKMFSQATSGRRP